MVSEGTNSGTQRFGPDQLEPTSVSKSARQEDLWIAFLLASLLLVARSGAPSGGLAPTESSENLSKSPSLPLPALCLLLPRPAFFQAPKGNLHVLSATEVPSSVFGSSEFRLTVRGQVGLVAHQSQHSFSAFTAVQTSASSNALRNKGVYGGGHCYWRPSLLGWRPFLIG